MSFAYRRRSLRDVRAEALTKLDRADRDLDEVRNTLAETRRQLGNATKSREEAELRFRAASEEQKRAEGARLQLDQENKELRERYEQLKVLCKGLQSARKHPKECQGI